MSRRRTGWMILGLATALTTATALIAAPGSNAPGNAPAPGSGNSPGFAPGKPGEGDPNEKKGERGGKHATGAKIGDMAPAFTLKGIDGKEYKLSDYSGKVVVLEWFNPECPIVKKAHSGGTLKGYGTKVAKDGRAVWLAVNSGAPGMEGAGLDKNQAGQKALGIEYPILLDESGVVGNAYGATNTPHMFIISKEGKLVYAGAIDNAQSKGKDEATVNYIEQALNQIKSGESVIPSQTKAYGCKVKYASKS